MFFRFLKKTRNKIYHRIDNKYYYGQFKGSLSFWKLLLFNILYPGRMINQIRFNQIKFVNFIKNKSKNLYSTNSFLKKSFLDLNNDGSIILNSFFQKKIIDDFNQEYKEEIIKLKNQKAESNKYFKNTSLTLKDSLIKIWLNEDIIDLIENYMGTKLYARNYPTLNYSLGYKETSSRTIHNDAGISEVTDVWHVDHSTLISFHVFLEEVKKEGTCMEYLKGTNKFLNSNFAISDEIVELSNKEILQCYGPKGSVNIHCGNVIHRMRPKPNSDRLMLTFSFTAGSNIMIDVKKISACLSSGFDLENLNFKKRSLLEGIFPKSFNKGYNLNNGVLKPTSFRGI